MKTIKNLAMITLFGILFIACSQEGDESKKNEIHQNKAENTALKSTVQVIRKSDLNLRTVENNTVKSFVPITGRVIPKSTTQLVSEVQGRILNSGNKFKSGIQFSKGEVIIQIDNREFALNIEAQKSAFLNILIGAIPDLKADYPDNYQSWLEYVNSYKTGKPLPALPKTKSNPEKYFLTSKQVYNTYFSIKAQEERLKKFTLRAPFTGSLSSTTIDNGGLVSPGQSLGTFISDTNYEIESAVKLVHAKKLKIGQKIDFFSKGLDEKITAIVTRINNIVDPNTQNIPIYLSTKNKELKSGMYVEGQVVLRKFENAVNIPLDIINRDNTVHILDNDIIVKKTIEIINTNKNTVTVRGLKNNTRLILTTFERPVSGLKITQ